MSVFRSQGVNIHALREVPSFAALPRKDLETLARYTTEAVRPAGTVLVEQDHIGLQIMYLRSGRAVVQRDGQEIAELGPGDVVGEMAMIDGKPSSATVTLTEDAMLLVMSVDDFNHAMYEVVNLPSNLLRTLTGRLRSTDHRIVSSSQRNRHPSQIDLSPPDEVRPQPFLRLLK